MTPRSLALRFVQASLLAAALLAGPAAPAQACDASVNNTFGLSPGCLDIRIAAAPVAGNLAPGFSQAGGHPYEVISAMRFNAPSAAHPTHGPYWSPEGLKDVRISLPPGLVADPTSVPSCTVEQLAAGNPTCPSDSQVGVVSLHFSISSAEPVLTETPLYRIAAPPGVPVRLGFNGSAGPVAFEATGDAGDLSIELRNISEGVSITGMAVALWGVPGDPAHNPQRACPGQAPPGASPLGSGPSCAATLPERAFLRLPTSCTGPATVASRVDSWQHPGVYQTTTVLTHGSPGLLGDPTAGSGYPAAYPGLPSTQWGAPEGFQGCGGVPFDPSLAVRLDSGAADTPTGLDLEVKLPQRGMREPSAFAEADLRAARMELPAGLSINPSVANGLSACSAAQFGLGTGAEPTCPDSSKLGTVEIASPVLEAPLRGSIYNAAQDSGASREIPAYITAGTDALRMKLRSGLQIDSSTGRVSASFDDSPQVPISSLRMHFFGGDRAPFISPRTCGSYASSGLFTPWSGTGPVRVGDSLEIVSGPGGGSCASAADRPFKPGLEVGVTSAVAGVDSVLSVELSRKDGEQEPKSLEMSLPSGLSASLRGIGTCPEAAIDALAGRSGTAELATPSCPPASRVGVARAALGAGTAPLVLDGGKIYLAGAYRGAARSFVIVLPAVAGPLDLDTLTMRLPLRLAGSDGRMKFKADFPTVQNGVALNLRRLRMDIDRPGFIRNPTNCKAKKIEARLDGDGGAVAKVSTPFQIIGCASLGFDPRLGVRLLGGRPATHHTAHPALRAVLRTRGGDANLKGATIVFPGSEQMDPTHISSICGRSDFEAGQCPSGSIYGRAEVLSPVLGEPLRGPVYLRNSKRKLPDIVASLHGQLDLDLVARIGFDDGRLLISMDRLPDLPVSKLVLAMAGGRRGVFVNNRDLCAAPSFSSAEMKAQNGKTVKRTTQLDVPCG